MCNIVHAFIYHDLLDVQSGHADAIEFYGYVLPAVALAGQVDDFGSKPHHDGHLVASIISSAAARLSSSMIRMAALNCS